MDKDYFEDPDKVRFDFERYSEVAGKDALDLPTLFNKSVICSNGANVKFTTYLHTAGKALELAKNTREAASKRLMIRNKLLETAGYELIIWDEMDKEYFEDREKVSFDLANYQEALGKDVFSLNVTSTKSAICHSGEIVTFATYLRRAGTALGFAASQAEITSRKDVFNCLLEIGGYEVMNKNYFGNGDNVRYDLDEFSKKAGIEVRGLTTLFNKSVICSSGANIKFITYLSRAAVALGFAKFQADIVSRKEILDHLLEMSGYKVMNKEYF
jgi:hypothetical protein